MIAIIPANPAPEVRAEPPPRPQLLQALLARPPAHQLPRQRLANPSDAGGDDHRACESTRRKCCAMSNLPRSSGVGMTCEHADCHNFPSRLVGKPELNFAAFCQASLPREFYGTSERHPL
jgi:hypothetical protein